MVMGITVLGALFIAVANLIVDIASRRSTPACATREPR